MKSHYFPFLLLGVLMMADEFYFHEKRTLPKWERIGHPLDTLTALVTQSLPLFLTYNSLNSKIYFTSAIFSCLFITKDEFIHNEHCGKMEQWLHSILFILHPVTLASTYFIWSDNINPLFLIFQALIIASFMLYQILRWSGPWQVKLK